MSLFKAAVALPAADKLSVLQNKLDKLNKSTLQRKLHHIPENIYFLLKHNFSLL